MVNMTIRLITYVVSTGFTYILGKLSKKFGWNESLPIPMQNILVGLIVLFISVIALRIMGEYVDISNIVEQIIVSFGGAGTATLVYDSSKVEEE